MNPWELEWHEFELPDGLTASYAIDGKEIRMMVDEEQIPNGLSIRERFDACYEHFFTEIYPTL